MSITGISFAGLNASAALTQGNGLGHYGQVISDKLRQSRIYDLALQARGAVQSDVHDPDDIVVTFDPQTDVTPTLVGQMNTLANNREFGSGAFTAVVPGPHTATLGSGALHEGFRAYTANLHGGNSIKAVALIDNAKSVALISEQMYPTFAEARKVNFGVDPSVEKLDLNSFDQDQWYLGKEFNNPIDLVTNGYTYLVVDSSDLPTLGQDFLALGSAFNLINPMTFGNPGQLIQACYTADIAVAIGMPIALANVGLGSVAFDDLDLPIYNDACKQALAQLETPEILDVVKRMLEVTNTQIETLSDFTVYEKILPNHSVLHDDTLEEFQQRLQELEYGEWQTAGEFGTFLGNVSVPNMPTRGNEAAVCNENMLNEIESSYLYRGGAFTLNDLIGSVGGIGVSENVDAYVEATNALWDNGTLDTLRTLYQNLIDASEATYTTPDEKGSFVLDALNAIADETAALHSKENINATITTAIESYIAIAAKTTQEKAILDRGFNLYLADRTNDKQNVALWATNLVSFLDVPSDMDLIEGMATAAVDSGDALGEYLLSAISEARNIDYISAAHVRYAGGVQSTL